MAKLIELNEAAALLGVTPDELNDMRSRNEIFGYRDGASWKFKMAELERVAEERGITLGSGDAADSSPVDADDDSDGTIDADFDELFGNSADDDSDTEDSESILVSEEELGESERSTSSTIIGKAEDGRNPSDSDLRLADADNDPAAAAKSDIDLADDASDKPVSEISDLKLADDDSDPATSDIGLAGGSDIDLGSDLGLAGSDILGGTGSDKASGSDLSLDDDDDEALELAADNNDNLELGEDLSDIALGGGSDISLDDDDGDLVLDGGSDVSLAGDSGINLAAPIDSGISLEDDDPLELSGSGISSLELPEDDDQVISLEEEDADPDAATQLKADNDFMLTPVDEDDDDPSDSGSQVIALDTEELDAEAATQLGVAGGDPFGDGPGVAIPAEPVEPAAQGGLWEGTGANMGQAQAGAGYAPVPAGPAELPERPYSFLQVLSLFIVVLVLAFSGMLMVDVIRNIWSFDKPYQANTALMDMVLDAVGKN